MQIHRAIAGCDAENSEVYIACKCFLKIEICVRNGFETLNSRKRTGTAPPSTRCCAQNTFNLTASLQKDTTIVMNLGYQLKNAKKQMLCQQYSLAPSMVMADQQPP